MRPAAFLLALAALVVPAAAEPLQVEATVIDDFPAIPKGAEDAPLLFLAAFNSVPTMRISAGFPAST